MRVISVREISSYNICKLREFVYNKEGRLMEDHFSSFTCDSSFSTAERWIRYGYDSLGRELTMEIADSTDPKDDVRANLVYNEDGVLAEENYRATNGGEDYFYSYHYDFQGRLTEKYERFAVGHSAERTLYRYNEKGQLIAETGVQGSDTIGGYEYTWHENGMISQIRYFQKKYELYAITDYDTLGNRTDESTFSRGQLSGSIHYSYEFDAHNNWVRKTEFVHGKAVRIYQREFTYW